jgi:hypothetical protein
VQRTTPAALTIRGFETVPLRVPLPRVYRGSNYQMTHRSTIVVRLLGDDGVLGEAYVGDEDETNIHDNGDGGDVGPTDFDFWKANYVGGPGSGGTLALGVPEPTSALLLMVAIVGSCGFGSRRRAR